MWTGTILLIFFIVAHPSGAAGSFHSIGNGLYTAADNVSTFFQQLF